MGSLVGCGLSLGFLAGRWVMVGYPWIGCGLSTNDFGARGSGQPVGNPYPLDPCRALAMAVAKNPVFHNRTKHIAIKYHFIREKIQEGLIDLHYMKGEKILADGFTKSLPKIRFKSFVEELGLRDGNSISLGGSVGSNSNDMISDHNNQVIGAESMKHAVPSK